LKKKVFLKIILAPNLSRIFDFRHVSYSGNVLAAAPEPHVTVVGGVDEPAAEAHVQAAQDHDAARNSGEKDQLKMPECY